MTGHWLLITDYRSPITDHRSVSAFRTWNALPIPNSALGSTATIGHFLLVIGYRITDYCGASRDDVCHGNSSRPQPHRSNPPGCPESQTHASLPSRTPTAVPCSSTAARID